MRRSLLAVTLGLILPASALAVPVGEVVAGFGFGGYTGDLGNVTNVGFTWNGRFGAMFNHVVGAEIGYMGLSSSFDNVVLANGVFVGSFSAVQQTVTANAKAGIPIYAQDSQFYVYALAGAGYSNISFTQNGFFVGTSSDSAFVVPVGGGLSFVFPSGLMLDGRATYNFLTGDRTPVIKSGNSWIVGFNLGARFAL